MSDGAVDPIGCAFILELGMVCGAALRPASPYCASHHVLCHLVVGGKREAAALLKIAALAGRIGGRSAGNGLGPSARFLRRLEARTR